jgi:hypothetical protein
LRAQLSKVAAYGKPIGRSEWTKGETADLGFGDFLGFWDFLGFFGIWNPKIQIVNNGSSAWFFCLYVGFVVLRISWKFQHKRTFPSQDIELARNTHIPPHIRKSSIFENSIFLERNICLRWNF